MTSCVKSIGANIILFAYLITTAAGCNMYSQSTKQIEANIERLREAQSKLLKNPNDKQALSVILSLMRDKNGINRANAAAVLGEVGEDVSGSINDEAVPALINLLDKGDEFDKRAAACALRKFGPHAKAAIPVLIKNLTPSDRDVAWCSAEALGTMNELAYEAVPDLVKVIKEGQSEYQDNSSTNISPFATKALGEIGSAAKDAVSDLASLLNHKNPYFRIRLAVAIIRIDPTNQQALGVLESLLKDQDVEVRRNTIWTLKDIGEEARPAKNLVRTVYLKDSDASVTSAASELLHILDKH
jgi:HEAT repeat protein